MPIKGKFMGIHKTCPICQKTFYVEQAKIDKRIYCSNRCAHLNKPAWNSNKNDPRYVAYIEKMSKEMKQRQPWAVAGSRAQIRTGRYVKCAQCGNSIWRTGSRRDRNKYHFCDSSCYGVWKKVSGLCNVDANPNWKGGISPRECHTCKQIFLTRDKHRKYCSHKCTKRINLGIKGRRLEWKARDELRKEGYLVVRSAGSRTPIDLIAIGLNKILLVQVKATKIKDTTLQSFTKDIQQLEEIPCPQCCIKELWIWYNNNGWKKHKIEQKIEGTMYDLPR